MTDLSNFTDDPYPDESDMEYESDGKGWADEFNTINILDLMRDRLRVRVRVRVGVGVGVG